MSAQTSEPTPPVSPPRVRQLAVLAILGVLVGLLAGLGASAFIKVEGSLLHWLWADLPKSLGYDEPPGWLAIALLMVGGLIVFGASKLPGHAGHSPLQGLGIDIGPREVTSVVIAAMGSLCFGAVLGPEAPLMAIGTALGAVAFRDPTKPVRTIMMLAGAMAAIGAIFGNPLVTAILLLEIAIVGGARLANPGVLLAALSALASGYTLQVGIEGWSGLGRAQLAVPGLPSYPSVHTTDVLLAVPLALIVAAISMAARIGGERIYLRAQRQPLATILVSAVVIGLSAVAVAAITGGGLDLVLFSGQDAMPDYLAITSLGTALVILAGKFVAYTFSLGSGFRGGPIFPAVALGTILATGCALLVHGSSLSALSATCIAAAVAAALRMPFTAALLAVLLTASAGGATTVLAIVGAVVGMLARLGAEGRLDVLAAPRKL